MVLVHQTLAKVPLVGMHQDTMLYPKNQISTYAYPISITNSESMAIMTALKFIKDNPLKKERVNIFTDCQTTLQFLNFQSYPKYKLSLKYFP